MAPTNNFLPFCPTDTGTNLLTQADYIAAAGRTDGNQPGLASSKLNNKALRQGSFITSQIAQLVANLTGTDVLDDGITAKFLAQLSAALAPMDPAFSAYLSGSGTHNLAYFFAIETGSATAGATYTNNAITYTVVSTVASGVLLQARGSGAPLVSGTLTKASGSGDATLTFYAVRAPLYLTLKMVGGGGGGGGSGTTQGTAATAGGNTTFGTTLLLANGGGAASGGSVGTAGSASLGTGPLGHAVAGAPGGFTVQASSPGQTVTAAGGMGGVSAFGGAGSQNYAIAGANSAANSGSGGGGAGNNAIDTANTGGGGGSGGFVDAYIPNPLSTYAYVVGAAGAGQGAGTSGFAGGNGGSGGIWVTEYYQ